MRPRPAQRQISPKVSTMPRQKTEAAAYLNIYKLVNERKRLQQELATLEQRRERIQQRLEVIEQQVNQLENDAHRLRDECPIEPKPITTFPDTSSESFTTIVLEY